MKGLFFSFAMLISACQIVSAKWISVELAPPKKNPGAVIKKMVDGKNAQILRSVKEEKFKEGRGSVRSFRFRRDQIIHVEYDFHAVKNSSYPLICSGPDGRKILVPTVTEDGRFRLHFGRNVTEICKLDLKKWHKIRYTIYPAAEKIDIFVDDMKRPVISGVKFARKLVLDRLMLYSLGHHLYPSETAFADIRYRLEKQNDFPAAYLAEAPFYLAGVRKLDRVPAEADWKNVPAIPLTSAGKNRKYKTSFKMLSGNDAFFCRFYCEGNPKPVKMGRDGKLWMHDCVELFIQPDREKAVYYHLIGNVAGDRYDARCEKKVRDISYNGDWKFSVTSGKDSWQGTFIIPFAAVGSKGQKDLSLWGINAGREDVMDKVQASWIQSGSFHDVKNFGKAVFRTGLPADKHLVALYTELGKKIFDPAARLNFLQKELAKASPAPGTVPARGKAKLAERHKKFAGVFPKFKAYCDFQELDADLTVLETDIYKWLNLCSFYDSVFGGKNAGKNAVLRVLSGARKISPEQYRGEGGSRAELLLAGGETAGFTVVLIPAPGKKISRVETAWKKLPGGIGAASFRLLGISGAPSGKRPSVYFDAMLPGQSFKIDGSPELIVFYCELAMPRKFSQQTFKTSVTVSPAGMKPIEIPVSVRHAGFDLPEKTTLDTVFCFVMSWAEQYYGRRLTRKEKEGFWKMIADHRLEPVNLWGKDVDGMFDYCLEKCNKKMLFLRIKRLKEAEQLLKKYRGRLRPIFFGYDEILVHSTPAMIKQMTDAYNNAGKMFPGVERMNTSAIDPRLFGAVNVWCPHFNDYRADEARKRIAKKETVWWYLTGIPAHPWPNLNLDSPETDARVIPWLTGKLNISGLLYWALNREFVSNAPSELPNLSSRNIESRFLDWATPENMALWQKNKVRWPKRPWMSFYWRIGGGLSSVECGAGNLLYPGSDVTLWPSVRLKNLRDGLQDYEYLVRLRTLLPRVRDAKLRKKIAAAASVRAGVVRSSTDYTKNMDDILAEKQYMSDLIKAAEAAVKEK